MAASRLKRVEHLMGTVFTIDVYDDGPDGVLDAAFGWLHQVEATFSTFLPDSEISRISRHELDPDDASADVRHVLSRCAELETATVGRFDIRPRGEGLPPLDPAGFVKGWSVDEAALLLRIAGLRRFVVDAGGDVLCVGTPPGGEFWRVGLRHPDRPDSLCATIGIPEGAVATSGRYFRGDHIWGDKPPGDVTSVTVIGPSLGVADALATAIFSDRAADLSWMSLFPDYGVALVTSDGRLSWTSSRKEAASVV